MSLSFLRHSLIFCCTLFEYGSEGGGSLATGIGGHAGQSTPKVAEVVAQPVKLNASSSASRPCFLFPFSSCIDRSYYFTHRQLLGIPRSTFPQPLCFQARVLRDCISSDMVFMGRSGPANGGGQRDRERHLPHQTTPVLTPDAFIVSSALT